MFGIQRPSRKRGTDEGEKPFWISFSDLMTALMVLFLVSMTVALLAVTNEINEIEMKKQQREKEIDELLKRIQSATNAFPGITVRGRSIDFGDRARFDTNKHTLTPEQERSLRSFVPEVLRIARDPLGEKWIKRVVVEGFADQRGTYMHNLDLSLHRSERVLCVLMAGPEEVADALSARDRLFVRDLFLVGGSSFNSLKESLEESRRIELKLEFLDFDEKRTAQRSAILDLGAGCPLD